MKVKMKIAMSGTRDGGEWPPIGGVIDLPDAEAVQYLAADIAEPVSGGRVEAAVADEPAETATVDTQPKRRGRPPGSKNKPKLPKLETADGVPDTG